MRKAILFACLAVLAVTPLAATGSDAHAAKGVVSAVSPRAISVKAGNGATLTCRVGDRSPSVAAIAVGDRVEAVCAGHAGTFVLTKLKKVAAKGGSADSEPVRFAGSVTSLSTTSVSLHDGDRDLTCTFDSSSPPLTGVKVGQHIRVTCAGGVLKAWEPVQTPPTTTTAPTTTTTTGGSGGHEIRAAAGVLASLSTDRVTVRTDGGDVSCSLSSASPSAAAFHVGDRVRVACLDGVLMAIAGADSASAGPLTVLVGTISVLSGSSVTVHGEHADLTCSISPTSRLLDGFRVGDRVGLACLNGAVLQVARPQ
jgi:hypothetical protein